MSERWATIDEFPSYAVSDKGRVKNIKNGNILTPVEMKNGYSTVNLYNSELRSKTHQSNRYVHRLVAKAFVENPNNYHEVNHLDENKRNNNYENLEWCSRSYNINYGSSNRRRRIKEGHALVAIELNSGATQQFDSVKEACKELKIDENSCRRILHHKKHCKSLHGYTFVYASEYRDDLLDSYISKASSKNDSLKKKVYASKIKGDGSWLTFESVAETARDLGLNKVDVYRVAKGLCKQSHGWKFKYAN